MYLFVFLTCCMIMLVYQSQRINAMQEEIIQMQMIDWRGPMGAMGHRGFDCNETRVIEEILKRIHAYETDSLDPRTLVSNTAFIS